MSILLFFLVLFVLVLVHEWGHFITAKKTGMRVDEFAIGFPPKLFGIKKGETEYTFNLLPIGGFVRIWGENKEDATEVANQADKGRAFSDRPKWAQALVLVAGVIMNVLLAWLLFSIVLFAGVPSAVSEENATDNAELYVLSVLPGSPAAEMLPVGATIESVTGAGVTVERPTPTQFSEVVQQTAPEEIGVAYLFNGEEGIVAITPEQGFSESNQDQYLIGTSLSLVEEVKRPIHIAIRDGLTSTIDGLVAITTGIYGLIRDAIFGEADFSTVAGPVGIVGMVGDAADFGWTALLSFTAIISLNLAVINLLPFPALDGGRLLFVIIESITKKEIPPKVAGYTNAGGFLLLLLLMVLVTYQDIMRLL